MGHLHHKAFEGNEVGRTQWKGEARKMCCENKSAKEAFLPTGTWLDRTNKDTFTAGEVAEAEGCSPRTIQRAVDCGDFGDLPTWTANGSVRIPRLSVIHFHDFSRRRRRERRRP